MVRQRRLTRRQRLKLYESGISFLPWMVDRFGKWRAAKAGIDVDDLFQAARLGLWRAVGRYDPATGIKLMTYASRFVMGSMLDAVDVARYGKRPRHRPLIDQSAFERMPEVERGNDDDAGSGML